MGMVELMKTRGYFGQGNPNRILGQGISPVLNEQGEIDVLGIYLPADSGDNRKVYICEVAVHVRGLQYMNSKRGEVANKSRIKKKFERDIKYAKYAFPDDKYEKVFMFWSPFVGNGRNQLGQLQDAVKEIRDKTDVEIELVINDTFYQKLNELKEYARDQTKEIKSPITRFLQVYGKLEKKYG